MTTRTVALTGALGNAGRVISRRLEEGGYRVIPIDVLPSRNPFFEPSRVVDLTCYGDTVANLHGADAVVHFGSNPWPDSDFFTGADRFRNNTIATFNVFQAACQLGIRRVVYASSETVQGHPYVAVHPERIPILESDAPLPQTAYALSKLTAELLGEHLCRMHGTVFLGLRCANILYDVPGHHAGYDLVPGYWADAAVRRETLWKYVDSLDVADAVVCALEAPVARSEVFNIAAADTIMNVGTRALFEAHFPKTVIADEFGEFATPVSLAKAADLIGWVPKRRWRDRLAGHAHPP
ncbi:SDR family oxidoreductase [Mesorhizobium sp. BR1-1-16]|uniref:NAD-dependent epimerase/dehydratase family protein n=1 Tax=Mesorhizobium sp. BR1-1-16 TaxID=2876653 RepID=UPI001CC9DDC5|nr:SDR family oxidoreductase [Mesorhizobium sp. BR1-1-16]MBZ9938553.1 SDR family oxidoreductase [Mesorhizobium sp. BR1-1-16]